MALSRGLADTSIFIAEESDRPMLRHRIPDEIAVSVVTIGELRVGVLTADDEETRHVRSSTLEAALKLQPVPIDETIAATWAELRVTLRSNALRMPVNDSWIAATAITLGVPVVTQDNDFPRLSELEVIQV